jgi:hypothetical protein
MDLKEKFLYHQIHPVKLLTDSATAIAGLYLLWRHKLVVSLIVLFVPPIIATIVVIQRINLEGYKESRLGKYINKYMTRKMELTRLSGMGVMAIGSWFHHLGLILLGLVVILFAWFRGVLFP